MNFFPDTKYKDKIYTVTKFRLISYEIYKFFLLYIFMNTISTISLYLPIINQLYEIKMKYFIIIKIFFFLLLIDMTYYLLLKSNSGKYSLLELIITNIYFPNLSQILSIALSFISLIFLTKNFISLYPKINSDYIRELYDIEPVYKDDEEENYYVNKGLQKDTLVEMTERKIIFIFSFIMLLKFVIIKNDFYLWPKINICRIDNLKRNIWLMIKNIFIIGIPVLFFIYLLISYEYHNFHVFKISFNYLSLFLIEYNLLFTSQSMIKNFICPKINHSCKQTITEGQVIRFYIDFKKEESFYIIHHLKHLVDFYKYPHNVNLNQKLLKKVDLDELKNKINYFDKVIDDKKNKFLERDNKSKRLINSYKKDFFSQIKIIFYLLKNIFDFSANEIFENDTCFEIIKLYTNLLINVIIFIAEAKFPKDTKETIIQRYIENRDFIGELIDKLVNVDKALSIVIQNNKVSNDLNINCKKLREYIRLYFGIIKKTQTKYQFITLDTQNVKFIFGNNF